MDWQPGEMSDDIEDRRGDSGGGGGFGFGGGGFGGGGLGIVGFLVLLVISLVTGRNFIGAFFGGGGGSAQTSQVASRQPREAVSPEDDRSAHLVSFTLNDVQKTWTTLLPEQTGRQYRHARLVLYNGQTYSGCGTAQAQTGPFYCPEDEKVYIDLGFWNELRQMGGSTADFAQSYVVAHELGHHVQKILGIEQKVQRLSGDDPSQKNHLSVDLELQADCLAGVWGHATEQRKIIDEADVEEGLKSAAAVGDDHLQKMERGTVSPETFTHGTSAQRVAWFKRGLEQGTVGACNTFEESGQ